MYYRFKCKIWDYKEKLEKKKRTSSRHCSRQVFVYMTPPDITNKSEKLASGKTGKPSNSKWNNKETTYRLRKYDEMTNTWLNQKMYKKFNSEKKSIG